MVLAVCGSLHCVLASGVHPIIGAEEEAEEEEEEGEEEEGKEEGCHV